MVERLNNIFLDFVRTDKSFSKYFNGFYLLFTTGLRISEFCGLTINDIDFSKKVIRVRRQLIRSYMNGKVEYYIEETKTEKGERIAPMLFGVEAVLRDVIANRPKLSKEPIVWNKEYTINATGFLWFDKNMNLEVAQHWQNHNIFVVILSALYVQVEECLRKCYRALWGIVALGLL